MPWEISVRGLELTAEVRGTRTPQAVVYLMMVDMSSEEPFDDRVLAPLAEVTPDTYPNLHNFSAAFFVKRVPVDLAPVAPEYVYVPVPPLVDGLHTEEGGKIRGAIAEWNSYWETGRFRGELLANRMPPALSCLSRTSGRNIVLLPDEQDSRYEIYAPLFHLLPARVLRRHGLPLLRGGYWPLLITDHNVLKYLPGDFEARLTRAFGEHVWPLLAPRSRPQHFGAGEPVHLLTHNLDFWRPYVDIVVQELLREFDRVPVEDEHEARWFEEAKSVFPADLRPDKPLKGGDVWLGEDDAAAALAEVVEVADERGRLRAIVDAVRSHRVEDDFSARWGWEKADFERKLYRKRDKIKVNFVELNETIPVHGPNAELDEDLLWSDLFALCDARERRVVVCLRSGTTRVGDIARELGYANHSPVSKALSRIRRKVLALLGES